MSAAPPPVFVDDTGRRRILTRRAGRIVVLGFTGYLGLVALGFARDPRVGPVHLPTFGLPSLGLVVPPAPAILGAETTRTAAEAGSGEADQATAPPGEVASSQSPTTTLRSGTPSSAGGPTASRAMAPNTGLQGSKSSTTTSPSTSSSSSTTSSTATTTTSTLPGQGQGQGLVQRSDAASTRGPGDSGPPGQQRKTTTTTAG